MINTPGRDNDGDTLKPNTAKSISLMNTIVVFISGFSPYRAAQLSVVYQNGVVFAVLCNLCSLLIAFYTARLLIAVVKHRRIFTYAAYFQRIFGKWRAIGLFFVSVPCISIITTYYLEIIELFGFLVSESDTFSSSFFTDSLILPLAISFTILLPTVFFRSARYVVFLGYISILVGIALLSMSVAFLVKSGAYTNIKHIPIWHINSNVYAVSIINILAYTTGYLFFSITSLLQHYTVRRLKSVTNWAFGTHFLYLTAFSLLNYLLVGNQQQPMSSYCTYLPNGGEEVIVVASLQTIRLVISIPIVLNSLRENVLSLVLQSDKYSKTSWVTTGVWCLVLTGVFPGSPTTLMKVYAAILLISLAVFDYIVPTLAAWNFHNRHSIMHKIFGCIEILVGPYLIFVMIKLI